MQAFLVMFGSDGSRRDFAVKTGKRYVIGRKETCDLQLPFTNVSREHAAVYYDEEDEEFVIEDLKSANGTFLNNERIEKSELCPGDVILIGSVPLQVVIDGHPAQLKPLTPAMVAAAGASGKGSTAGKGAGSARGAKPQAGGAAAASPRAAKSGDDDDDEEDAIALSGAGAGPSAAGGDDDDEDALIDMPDQSDSFFAFDLDEDENSGKKKTK